MKEAQIIADCIRKKSKAQEILFKEYAPYIYTICRRYETTEYLADDCLQDVFLKIFEKLNQYDPAKGSLKNWITRITINHALNKIRSQKIEWKSIEDYNEVELTKNFSGDEVELYSTITEEALLDYIAELPKGYRTVFNLYVIDAHSHAEIAQKLEISTSTSKSQLFKARTMLKKMITTKVSSNYGA